MFQASVKTEELARELFPLFRAPLRPCFGVPRTTAVDGMMDGACGSDLMGTNASRTSGGAADAGRAEARLPGDPSRRACGVAEAARGSKHEAAEDAIGKPSRRSPRSSSSRHRAYPRRRSQAHEADTCPDLWEEVQKLASPSFTDDPLAAPSGLSPPERALVLFGQAAVATWLEEIRTFKFEDEEESSDG